MPFNCGAWGKYAELEQTVGETDRSRAIFELAIGQSVLDMPGSQVSRPAAVAAAVFGFFIFKEKHFGVRYEIVV